MELGLEITLDNNESYETRYDLVRDSNFGFVFRILAGVNDRFESLITDFNGIEETLLLNVKMKGLENTVYSDTITSFLRLLRKKPNYLDSIEYIFFDSSEIEVLEFLRNNPSLKSKKIVLNMVVDVNYDISFLDKIFSEYNNIYLHMVGNDLPITISDFKQIQKTISDIVEEVNRYSFSPLEKVMYVYDIVRDRKYISEDDNESYTVSRDLSKVLYGDKIVCVGYANIIKAVLDRLGISNISYIEKNKEKYSPGHQYNCVYLKDDSYDIDGIYFLDATGDRKRLDDNSHFERYIYFLKNKKEMDDLHDNKYVDTTLPSLFSVLSLDFINNLTVDKIRNLSKNEVDTINRVSLLVDKTTLIKPLMLYTKTSLPPILRQKIDITFIKDRLNKYRLLLSENINKETLLKAIYNVRKVEYYYNPEKFDLSRTSLFHTFLFSFEDPEYGYMTQGEYDFFRIIYGKSFIRKLQNTKDFSSVFKSEEMDKKIEQVRLTKTLKLICEKRRNELDK